MLPQKLQRKLQRGYPVAQKVISLALHLAFIHNGREANQDNIWQLCRVSGLSNIQLAAPYSTSSYTTLFGVPNVPAEQEISKEQVMATCGRYVETGPTAPVHGGDTGDAGPHRVPLESSSDPTEERNQREVDAEGERKKMLCSREV